MAQTTARSKSTVQKATPAASDAMHRKRRGAPQMLASMASVAGMAAVAGMASFASAASSLRASFLPGPTNHFD